MVRREGCGPAGVLCSLPFGVTNTSVSEAASAADEGSSLIPEAQGIALANTAPR